MKEENIRFILLAVLLFLYLAVGAFVFQAVEQPAEKKIRDDFVNLYDQFVRNLTGLHSINFGSENHNSVNNNNGFNASLYGGPDSRSVGKDNFSSSFIDGEERRYNFNNLSNINSNSSANSSIFTEPWNSNGRTATGVDKSTSSFVDSIDMFYARQPPSIDNLHELLFAYGNATQAGVIWKRKRWDYVGSFHFTWTIVSTIGKLYYSGFLHSYFKISTHLTKKSVNTVYCVMQHMYVCSVQLQ